MRILYVVGYESWWGSYPPDILDREDVGSVGGGEQCALRTAAGLADLGHDVVYASVAQPGVWRGVRFVPIRDATRVYVSDGPWDAIVAWADQIPLIMAMAGEGRVFVQQLNDLVGMWSWSEFCDVISPASDAHGRFLRTQADTKDVLFHPIHNGIDVAAYPWPSPPSDHRPPWVGYWSSPDRGLIHLLQAWPKVRRAVPDARLRIYYSVKKYLQTVQWTSGMGSGLVMAEAVRDRLAALGPRDGVDLMDVTPHRALRRDQIRCRVMCYPCSPVAFTEGFGQAVGEAMAAGCLPIIRPADAFQDLWSDVSWTIRSDPAAVGFTDEIADLVIRGLRDWRAGCWPSQDVLRSHVSRFTWERSTQDAQAAIVKAMVARRQQAAA